MTDVIAGEAASTEVDVVAALHSTYGPRVRAYIAAFLSRPWAGRRVDGDLVEDLAQETWLSVRQSIDRFDGGVEAAMPWLAAIARRTVIAHFRLMRSWGRPAGASGAGRLPEAAVVTTLARRVVRQEPGMGVAA